MRSLLALHGFILLVFNPRFSYAFAPPSRRIASRYKSPTLRSPIVFNNVESSPDNNTRHNSDTLSKLKSRGGQAHKSSDLTVRRIMKFAIPAIGIWLCNPLLSVIDTSAVGLISGTVQQAALNPAVAVSDYSARLMYFLYTGTTNLIAVAYESDQSDPERTIAKNTLMGVLRLSLRVGIGLCVFLLIFATPMLRSLIGNNAASSEILSSAQKYVWIRSLGMPAAAMIGSAQAACLGMRDVKSPLMVTLLAAFVNLIADVTLVRHPHPWIGGTAGAAWATILSQYVAVIFYMQWLVRGSIGGSGVLKAARNRLTGLLNTKSDGNQSTKRIQAESLLTVVTEDKQPRRPDPVRGILKGRFRFRELFYRNRKDKSVAGDFTPYVVPVTTTQVGRCSVYVAMGMVVSGLSVVNMAANQILNAFFYALIPIADALSQTAQALLPPLFAEAPHLESNEADNVRALQYALTSFLKAALLCGGALAGIVAGIPWLTKTWMTSDPLVQQMVNSVVPIHMLIFTLHGVFCSSEGILLAQKDLGYLGRMYGLYFAVVPALMLQLKRYGTQLQLQTVWNVFLGYQLFRITAWVTRVFWLFRRRKVSIQRQQGTAADHDLFPVLATEK